MDKRLKNYINKISKKRDKNLKYDFMPSFLEIVERPSHIAGTVIIISISVLLLFTLIWATLSKVEVVVSGSGIIVPEKGIFELKTITAAEIKKVYVEAGDIVNEGDTILTLKNEEIMLDSEQLEYEINWCKIRYQIAEKMLEDISYDIDLKDYDAKFQSELRDLISDYEMEKSQKKIKKKELEKVRKELNDAVAENNKYLKETLEKKVESYKEELDEVEKTYKVQQQNKIYSIEKELKNYEMRKKKLDILKESYVIKSAVTGTVNLYPQIIEGQRIMAGDSVGLVVPNDEMMFFECYILDKDRSELKLGMDAVIKLSAYNFSDYGKIEGRVKYISPSSLKTEKMGNVFLVRIGVKTDGLNPKIKLIAGLSGNAEIITRKRSLLQYFLEPITKGLEDSLKEN